MSQHKEYGCWPIRKRETHTCSVSFEENKNTALEVWGRNMSSLFTGMVQIKHSLWCYLSQTKWLGHLVVCYMHQSWNEAGCLSQFYQGSFTTMEWGKSYDFTDCLISHIKAVDDELRTILYNEWQRIKATKTVRVKKVSQRKTKFSRKVPVQEKLWHSNEQVRKLKASTKWGGKRCLLLWRPCEPLSHLYLVFKRKLFKGGDGKFHQQHSTCIKWH